MADVTALKKVATAAQALGNTLVDPADASWLFCPTPGGEEIMEDQNQPPNDHQWDGRSSSSSEGSG